MVITKKTYLPSDEELTVPEVNLSAAFLMAGAFHLGKSCEATNNEFMLCRQEEQDPRKCIDEGKAVTKCSMEFFKKVKKNCAEEFTNYANCLDKSSTSLAMRYCRNTQAIYDTCLREKMGLDRPHIGYFTEARVHQTTRPKPPREPPQVFPDATPEVPGPEVKRPDHAKYGARWMLLS